MRLAVNESECYNVNVIGLHSIAIILVVEEEHYSRAKSVTIKTPVSKNLCLFIHIMTL